VKIGGKIKIARQIKGLSQKALAGKVGVSDATISRWESGEDTPTAYQHLKALAEALTQPVEYFTNDASPPPIIDIPQQMSWRAKRRLERIQAQILELFHSTKEGTDDEWAAMEKVLGGLLAQKTSPHGESARNRGVGR
jgi:transcriptional regulator with XRE-family HTH domain